MVNENISLYNPGGKEKQILIDEFVIRKEPFNLIIKDFVKWNGKTPGQQYLIVGQRGSGKTTLLNRIVYELEDNTKVQLNIVPVLFPEEQYGISSLNDLWEYTIEYLEDHGCISIKRTYELEEIFEFLSEQLESSDMHIVLFIDNINELFKKFEEAELKKLRRILIEVPHIRIIGASSTYFYEVLEHDEPFFEFFKVIQLKNLEGSEVTKLLVKLGQVYSKEKYVRKLLREEPERVEVLVRLTGGNPRTIVLMFQIFLDSNYDKSIQDLKSVLDLVTPLYKSKIDDLPTQQQKIFDAVAKYWDLVSTKQLAQRTNLPSKVISSQLSQLVKDQLIEKVPQEHSKNLKYRVRERFLNIWYLMRQGKRTDRSRVLWLVRFLEAWCDKLELEKRITNHIKKLRLGEFKGSAAILLGEAYYSCKTADTLLRLKLAKALKDSIPEGFEISKNEVNETAKELYENQKYQDVIDLLESVKEKGFVVNAILGLSYGNIGELDKAAEYLTLSFEENSDPKLAMNIGLFYEYAVNDSEKAKKYYEVADKDNIPDASHRLAHYYSEVGDYKKSHYYYERTINLGEIEAIMCEADLYYHENKITKAKKMYYKAIENDIYDAYVDLADIFIREGKIMKAIEFYEKGVEHNVDESELKLSIARVNNDEPEKALTILKKMIAKFPEDSRVNFYWGLWLYDFTDEKEKGLEHIDKSSSLGFAHASHWLGLYHDEEGNVEKAIDYFRKGVEKGHKDCIVAMLTLCYFYTVNKKEAFQILTRNREKIYNKKHGRIVSAYILLWNNKVKEALSEFYQLDFDLNQDGDDLLLKQIIEFVTLLIASGEFLEVEKLFSNQELGLKEIIKPIYLSYLILQEEERIEAISEEFKDTVIEVLDNINQHKKDYFSKKTTPE